MLKIAEKSLHLREVLCGKFADTMRATAFTHFLHVPSAEQLFLSKKKRKSESQFCAAASAWDAINSVTLFPFFTSIVKSSQVLFFYFAVV